MVCNTPWFHPLLAGGAWCCARQVNASLLRRINATPGLFLCHVKSPAALQVATGQQAAYQGVKRLQACFEAAATAADAEQQWQALLQAVDGVLRKAYQHVHSCKCDVVMGLQLLAEESEGVRLV